MKQRIANVRQDDTVGVDILSMRLDSNILAGRGGDVSHEPWKVLDGVGKWPQSKCSDAERSLRRQPLKISL
jgi:hypothetical protein